MSRFFLSVRELDNFSFFLSQFVKRFLWQGICKSKRDEVRRTRNLNMGQSSFVIISKCKFVFHLIIVERDVIPLLPDTGGLSIRPTKNNRFVVERDVIPLFTRIRRDTIPPHEIIVSSTAQLATRRRCNILHWHDAQLSRR